MMKRLQGFTLIELLIVVAIIGILAAIAVPNFLAAQVRARVAQAESEMRSLQSALEAFYIDNNQYMYMGTDRSIMNTHYRGLDRNDPTACQMDIAHLMIGNARTGRRLYLTTPVAYISSIPYDPFRGDGSEFSYGYGSDAQSYYILTSFGPDNGDGLAGVNGGELNECQYTGARLSNYGEAGIRNSKFTLAELRYDPSNGISSTGEIIRLGP